jgi:hypothetical protein
MIGDAPVVVRSMVKDGDKAYTVAISYPAGIQVAGTILARPSHIVSHVTNILGVILSSLPDGSRISLEAKPLRSYSKGKTKSAKGRKKRKKKSQRTGGRS